MRYFSFLKLDMRTAHERLSRLCFVDYDRQIAFVALSGNPSAILGVGRLVKIPNTQEAEAAFVVSDAMQRRGLGSELLNAAIQFARDESLSAIRATFLVQNAAMRKLLARAGFQISEQMREVEAEGVLKL
jgi:acetyltransferase